MAILKTRGTERDGVVCSGKSLQADVEHKKKKGMFYTVIARPGMQAYLSPSALP